MSRKKKRDGERWVGERKEKENRSDQMVETCREEKMAHKSSSPI